MFTMPKVDSARFWRDGYLLIKQVFTAAEIADIRRRAFQVAGKNDGQPQPSDELWVSPRDVLSFDELRDVLLDSRVLHIYHELLGTQHLLYFGDSVLQIGGGGRGWHKDNCIPDRYDHTAPDWNGRYTLLRFGLYLQDHKHHSGGLGIRVGSHEPFWAAKPPLPIPIRSRLAQHYGKPILVPSEPGDFVIWNMRTTHTGNCVRMRVFPNFKLPPKIESALPMSLRVPEPCMRAAVFCTLAAPSEHVQRNIDYLKSRDYMVKLWGGWAPSEETRRLATARGVELITPPTVGGELAATGD